MLVAIVGKFLLIWACLCCHNQIINNSCLHVTNLLGGISCRQWLGSGWK